MELVIASFALGIAVASGIWLYRTRAYLIATQKSLITLQDHVLDVGAGYNRAIKAHGETLDLNIKRLDDHSATLENHRAGLIDHKKNIDDHSGALQVMMGTDESLSLTVKNIGEALTELEKIVDPDTPIFNMPPKH